MVVRSVTTKGTVMPPVNNTVWTIVGILAIIALVIFVLAHTNFN